MHTPTLARTTHPHPLSPAAPACFCQDRGKLAPGGPASESQALGTCPLPPHHPSWAQGARRGEHGGSHSFPASFSETLPEARLPGFQAGRPAHTSFTCAFSLCRATFSGEGPRTGRALGWGPPYSPCTCERLGPHSRRSPLQALLPPPDGIPRVSPPERGLGPPGSICGAKTGRGDCLKVKGNR